jgi:hypothetical protein
MHLGNQLRKTGARMMCRNPPVLQPAGIGKAGVDAIPDTIDWSFELRTGTELERRAAIKNGTRLPIDP